MEQHWEILKQLTALGRKATESELQFHNAGIEYTSLMACFLLHNLSCSESLLRLSKAFGKEWFPVTVGYAITRTMFETDVNAHYITKAPAERARQYIAFGNILTKRKMDACKTYRDSPKQSWNDVMKLVWEDHWSSREAEIEKRYNAALPRFTKRHGKIYDKWSGISLKQMALEVDHKEAYDVFYSELSSFVHIDVHLTDKFLRTDANGLVWSQRADEFDVGNVCGHAANFLTCFLELFGIQFRTWAPEDVQKYWTLY